MHKITIVFLMLMASVEIHAQDTLKNKKDTIQNIEEVKVTGLRKRKIETDMKMAVSVDEFLASSDKISFIKRGAYAWEPSVLRSPLTGCIFSGLVRIRWTLSLPMWRATTYQR